MAAPQLLAYNDTWDKIVGGGRGGKQCLWDNSGLCAQSGGWKSNTQSLASAE